MTTVHFHMAEGEISFTLQLDPVPRIGDKISFEALDRDLFDDDDQYEKFRSEGLASIHWRVEDVIWGINPKGIAFADVGLATLFAKD